MRIQLKKSSIENIQDSSPVQIEKLSVEGEELESVLRKCLSDFTKGILDPDIVGKSPDGFIKNLQRGILGDFNNRYIIVAQDNSDFVGILIGLPEEENRLHIYSLHVSPEYRKIGVGSALLSRCINDMCMSDVSEIILEVHTDNKPAYRLYKKFDFNEVDN